jgi:SAM-dependent methyltransferase
VQSNNYFAARADRYLRRSDQWPWSWFRRREAESIAKLLEPLSLDTLIDLGCGAGYYSRLFKHQFKMRVVGVDSCAEMITRLKCFGIEGHQINIETLNLGSSTFDRVLMAGVLEFSQGPDEIFAKARTLAKQRGRLVILVPRTGVAGWLYAKVHKIQGCDVFLRTEAKYINLARQHGFSYLDRQVCTPISLALGFERS